jgi:hypothetical protein
LDEAAGAADARGVRVSIAKLNATDDDFRQIKCDWALHIIGDCTQISG